MKDVDVPFLAISVRVGGFIPGRYRQTPWTFFQKLFVLDVNEGNTPSTCSRPSMISAFTEMAFWLASHFPYPEQAFLLAAKTLLAVDTADAVT